MKLISMTEFVISQWDKDISLDTYATQIIAYAQFLKQPLHIGMFIPADEEGRVFKEPMYDPAHEQYWAAAFHEYKEMEDSLLFSGWTCRENYAEHTSGIAIDDEICKENTMEELIMNGYDLYLTPYAIKLLGL